MYNIKINFIVFSLSIQDDNINTLILSSEKDNIKLPSYIMTIDDSIENAKKLCFENYISLKIDWIEYKILDITKENNIINIYYICSIPIESKLINGYFIPLNKAIFEPIIQKATRFI